MSRQPFYGLATRDQPFGERLIGATGKETLPAGESGIAVSIPLAAKRAGYALRSTLLSSLDGLLYKEAHSFAESFRGRLQGMIIRLPRQSHFHCIAHFLSAPFPAMLVSIQASASAMRWRNSELAINTFRLKTSRSS